MRVERRGEGGKGWLGSQGFFFFLAESQSTEVERCKLFPNLNLHSSLTFMPRNPIIYKLIPTTLNPLSDTDENANVSVFQGKCTYGRWRWQGV